MRKWANFIKHPKGFLFSHHAKYLIENKTVPKEWNKRKKIAYKNIVEPLYKREDEKKFIATIKQLGNKCDLLVIIPDPIRLTQELIVVCEIFCDKIKNNEHFKSILKEHSVVDDYSYEVN